MELVVTRTITNKDKKASERTVNLEWDGPSTVAQAVERWGKDRVWTLLAPVIESDVRNEIARLMQGGIHGAHALADEEIVTRMQTYIPGTDQAALDRAQRALDKANAARVKIGLPPLTEEAQQAPPRTARKPRPKTARAIGKKNTPAKSDSTPTTE
jgi:hypothetical protein